MNAARPLFSSAFSPVTLAPSAAPATPAVEQAVRKPRRSRGRTKPQPSEPTPVGDEYSACLLQARICREQAQEAARLKRFKAATGLFQTAISLCQRAVSLRPAAPSIQATEPAPVAPDAESPAGSDGEASAYLQVLAVELSAYDELARSMNRPLLDSR